MKVRAQVPIRSICPEAIPNSTPGNLRRRRISKNQCRAPPIGGATIYGECGGYMALGAGLEDANGRRHRMLGLLPNETSFKSPKLRLGYRRLGAKPGAPFRGEFAGHEFHYARLVGGGKETPLFSASDSFDCELADMGHVRGRISGSFAHLICASRPV